MDLFEPDPDECNLSAPFVADFHACVSSPGIFAHTYDPALAPKASRTQSAAAVVNLFYTGNWLHDWYYDAGFREIDGNAQTSNFGRGGLGGDSMKVQAQDNAGLNNANMSTPADGGRPRMRLYLFTGNEAAAVTVSPPGTNLPVGKADFGPGGFDLAATMILATDGSATFTDACQPVTNNVAGKIALVDRGNCTFKLKALNAQNAGAIGMIVANNVSGVSGMADDPAVTATITLPLLMVSTENGASIKTSLAAGSIVTITVTGIPDGKRILVKLNNVSGMAIDVSAAIGFLVGDVNGSHGVNASDIRAAKARIGQALSTTNFVFDTDANGTISTSDVTAIKARSGKVIP